MDRSSFLRGFARDRPSRYGKISVSGPKRAPFTVGRGPVPRHAWDNRKPRDGQVFFYSQDREGQALALRY